MKIVQYSQHVLGVGHFFRSLAVASALSDHEVHLVTGGAEVPAALPLHVRHVPVPGLMMDADFSRLFPSDPGADLEDVKAARVAALRELMMKVRPDIFLVELYPFGRKRFEFELLPVLEALRAREFGPCRAVCSLRDILVEKKDPDKFETRVLSRLNALFDGVVVHADERLTPLSATFSRVDGIIPPVRYTGYVTPRPAPGAGRALREAQGIGDDERLVVASAGGGGVGGELLEAAVAASRLLGGGTPHRLQVFSGPYMGQKQFDGLFKAAGGAEHIRIERFATNFPDWLDAADLSVSMAGYNTSLNLLAAGTYGLVWPFAQNREQRMRAELLQERRALRVLEDADLDPSALAGLMSEALAEGGGTADAADSGVAVDGAAETARILEDFAAGRVGA